MTAPTPDPEGSGAPVDRDSSADPTRSRVVAAFDFDGTVSRRDTLVPFVAAVAGRRRSIGAGVGALAVGLRRQLNLGDRDEVKAWMVKRLLAGTPQRELEREGGIYATRLIDNGLRPEVVEQIRRHVAAGHHTLFVSASLVYYLDPIARHFNMDGVIAVEPDVRDGVLTGEMRHPNVRAEQKAIRLREALGLAPEGPLAGVELWAYGNSSGDHALLAAADHAFWLGRPSKCPSGSVPFVAGAAF